MPSLYINTVSIDTIMIRRMLLVKALIRARKEGGTEGGRQEFHRVVSQGLDLDIVELGQ